MTSLPRLLDWFIRLEIMAAELYRAHVHHVPVSLKPMMHHFAHVEEHHRDVLRRLYRELVGKKPPRHFHITYLARMLAWCLSWGGPSRILRFECFIEERAIRDYTRALAWVQHPKIRRAIHVILDDEKIHGPLIHTLKTFRHDECAHIKKMEEALRHFEKSPSYER